MATKTLYPRDQVEEIVAWASQRANMFSALASTTDIMRMIFENFDPARLGIRSRGEALNEELVRRGLAPLPRTELLWIDGPIICHNAGGWGPEWEGHPVRQATTKEQIRLERIETALGYSPFPVGPTEIMAVMYAATMGAPLRSEATEVYLWAGAAALDRSTGSARGTTADRLGDSNGAVRRLSDHQVLTEHPWSGFYRETAEAIRRKVIGHAQSTERRQRSADEAGAGANQEQLIALPGLF